MKEENEDSSDASSDLDPEDLQEGVRSERAISSAARRRPISKLRGKNNYVWSKNSSARTSGIYYFYYFYFDIYYYYFEFILLFYTCCLCNTNKINLIYLLLEQFFFSFVFI